LRTTVTSPPSTGKSPSPLKASSAARSAIEGPLRAYAELGGPEVTAEDELIEAVLDEVAAGRIEQHLTGRGLVDEGRRERRVACRDLVRPSSFTGVVPLASTFPRPSV
jgi:hypothetical protein